MTFREDAVETFVSEVFEASKHKIRAFPGCQHMELLRQSNHSCILFTFSVWDDEAALNAYRASLLFAETWKKTKALFAAKPEAWSLELLDAPGL